MPNITDVNTLIRNINNGWMSVNDHPTGRLYVPEKHLLIKHFEGRDPSSYTDTEKRFKVSQEAKDLQNWYDRFGHVKGSKRASGNDTIEWED